MFFSRSSATSSAMLALPIASSDDDEPSFSFRRLPLSHNDTPTSSPRSDPISSSATSFPAAPTLLIASSDEPTSSFRRLSFSHDNTTLDWSYDTAVHGANFIVARHVRRLACASCHTTDSGRRFSSPGAPHPSPIPALYPSCCPANPNAPPPTPRPQTPTMTSSASTSSSSSSRVPTAVLSSRIGIALDGVALSCTAKLRGGTRDNRITRARARSRARTRVAKTAEEG